MLSGRQLYLLRIRKNIMRDSLGSRLDISSNDVIIYENELRDIPEYIYNNWLEIVK